MNSVGLRKKELMRFLRLLTTKTPRTKKWGFIKALVGTVIIGLFMWATEGRLPW